MARNGGSVEEAGRYLRKPGGPVFGYTVLLAARGDMIECDKNGTPLGVPFAGQKTVQARTKPKKVEAPAPAAPSVDVSGVDSMNKKTLTAFALRNGLELDPAIPIGEARELVKNFLTGAVPAGAEA